VEVCRDPCGHVLGRLVHGDRYSMPPSSELMFELTRPKFSQKITREEWYAEYKKGNNVLAPK
jgi:hypothetical protein